MNLIPVDVKKVPKPVSFQSGNGYQFITGNLTSLYDSDLDRLYLASVENVSSYEQHTVAGIYRHLSHEIHFLQSKTSTSATLIKTVPHGSKLGADVITELCNAAENAYNAVPANYKSNSSPSDKVSLFINGYSIPLVKYESSQNGPSLESQLKLFLDAIGIGNLLSKETVGVYTDITSKIGVVIDDRLRGGKLIYKTVDYSELDANGETADNLFEFTPIPTGDFDIGVVAIDGQDISTPKTLFGYNVCPIVYPKYTKRTGLISLDQQKVTTDANMTYNINVVQTDPNVTGHGEDQSTLDDVFKSEVSGESTLEYVGQTYHDGEYIAGGTKLLDLDYNRTPLRTLYELQGDPYGSYHTGTIVIECDDADYNTSGVASVKMSYSGTLQEIWNRNSGYAISISDIGRIVYKGTITGSFEDNNLMMTRTHQRVMFASNAWAAVSATASQVDFDPNKITWQCTTIIDPDGKCCIKVPDAFDESCSILVDLFKHNTGEAGPKKMIIPPCAWYTDTKNTVTKKTTRQWYYLRHTGVDTENVTRGINSRATMFTASTDDYNHSVVKSFSSKVFFLHNTESHGGYKVFDIRLTRAYSAKKFSGVTTERTFDSISGSMFTYAGAFPISHERVTGQKYTF